MSQVLPHRTRAEVDAEVAGENRREGRLPPRLEGTVDKRGHFIRTHGNSGYQRGCRCADCTRGMRDTRRRWRDEAKDRIRDRNEAE